MKRIISTVVASVMLFASVATTAFAADYTMNLSSNVTGAAKLNDNVKITAKISTNVGLQSIGYRIEFDPTVFELVEDSNARTYLLDEMYLENEKAGQFMIDGIANESEEIESYYVTEEYAKTYYGYKATQRWGDPTIATVLYDEDGNDATATGKDAVRQTVGFAAAKTSAIKDTNAVANMVLGGINLKVINDSVASSVISIVEIKCTTDGTNFANVTAEPLTISIEGDVKKYNVSVGTVENGTVTLDATGEVEENTTVNVTATADEGYELEGIYVNDAKIDGTSFVVTADSVVTAKFTKKTVAKEVVVTPVKGNANAEGKFTQAFKASIKGNDEKLTTVNFILSNGSKEWNSADNGKGWTGLNITGASPVTFGVNVLNVPSDATVTANFIAE